MRPLGFIGLGAMGARMARNLVKAGHPLAVHDVNADAVKAAEQDGAAGKASAAEVARDAEVILVCVPKSDYVEQVFYGEGGIREALDDGKRRIVIDCSSSKAATSRRIGAEMRALGGDFLDAPVSGGISRAETGELAIIVGGAEATYEECRPVFDIIGANFFRVGELGMGNLAKALNNILSCGNVMIIGEALLIAAKSGLDPKRFADIAGKTLGESYAMERRIMGEVISGRYGSNFKMGLMYKDLTYAMELAAEARVAPIVAGFAHDIAAAATARYGEDADYTRTVNLQELWETGKSEVFGPV